MPSDSAISLTWDQVCGFRLRRQHLLEASEADPAQIASDLAGIHAQVMSAAETALMIRSTTITRQAVAAALWEKQTLLKLWGMRGTLHLFPTAEMGLWAGALRSRRPHLEAAAAWKRNLTE